RRCLFVMRYLDRAAADELAQDRVAGDEVERGELFFAEALDRFEQRLDPVVANSRVEKAGVGLEVLRPGQMAAGAGKEWFERRQVEGKTAVDDVVGEAAEGDDAEQFAGSHIVPVENG